MVGRADWTPVLASHVTRVTDDTWTFRFTPCAGTLETAKPGQHVMVQAQIDGRWIERPYTLTSPSGETAYHEITIKREEHGVFSRWMTRHCSKDTLVRISAPQGSTYFELADPRPVVCLVAGIGMTPALAMCRSIIREGTGQSIHVHYSASTTDRFAYVDELRAAAERHPNIRLTLRVTREKGRLSRADVADVVRDARDARFYLCGPPSYVESVKEHLAAAEVPADRVIVEVFRHAGGPTPGNVPPPRQNFPRMLYRDFVEQVLTKQIVLPRASDIAARLQAEHPELFEPANARMAGTTILLAARVGVTAALLAWAATRELYLLMALLWVIQGVNYYTLVALVHDFAHDAGFTRGWLNRLAGRVLSLPLLARFTAFRTSHLLHHRNNQSPQDPKVQPQSEFSKRFCRLVYDRMYAPAPVIVQKLLNVMVVLLAAAPLVMLRGEFSVLRRIRSRADLLDTAAMIMLWVGAFGLFGWQAAVAVLVGPVVIGYACVTIVFWTHLSDHSLYPVELDPADYDLMIFNVTNLTLGPWLDRLGCYFHRYHVEHHMVPTLPFHRLPQASAFVRREYGQYMLPVQPVGFEYTKAYVDMLVHETSVEIAGQRYATTSRFHAAMFGSAGAVEPRP